MVKVLLASLFNIYIYAETGWIVIIFAFSILGNDPFLATNMSIRKTACGQ
jgi:hypothetical protein